MDLVKPEIKLGLGDEKACAIGRKCKAIFEKNNISWEDVEKNLKFQSMTVNELGIQIQAKSLDAVIVWDAVAGYYAEHGDAHQEELHELQLPLHDVRVSLVAYWVKTMLCYLPRRHGVNCLLRALLDSQASPVFRRTPAEP